MSYHGRQQFTPLRWHIRGAREPRTTVGNANYTIKAWDKVVALTTSITGNRAWTLPLAASVPPGHEVFLVDETGSPTEGRAIQVGRSGSDKVNGSNSIWQYPNPYFRASFISDGVSNWSADPVTIGQFYQINVEFADDVTINGITTFNGTVVVDAAAQFAVDGESFFMGDASFNNIVNAKLRDSTTTFYDNADTTKKLAFQCSGIATATTRTATWPDENITVVGVAATQTLTNKTIPIADNAFTLQDNNDATKQLRFQINTITTGTLRNLTVPNADTTLVGRDSVMQDSAAAPMGYTTGAGGTVTQATSINTAVTIDKPCGRITMQGNIPASTTAVFTVNNSTVSNDDVIYVSLSNNPAVDVTCIAVNVANGSFVIRIRNWDAVSATAVTPIINFAVIKVAVS